MCVTRSRGDAETLQTSFPCSSSSVSHLLLIPLDQRVRQKTLPCLLTRNKEGKRNSPSPQGTDIPMTPKEHLNKGPSAIQTDK